MNYGRMSAALVEAVVEEVAAELWESDGGSVTKLQMNYGMGVSAVEAAVV